MPAATGSDVVCEYDGVSVALELAALSAFVVLLRYAAVLYANHLLATLSADDLPSAARTGSDGASSGLDDDAIARLPCFVVASCGAAAAATEECVVCLGAVEEGETARALPCCAHAFHARCVDAWLRLRPDVPRVPGDVPLRHGRQALAHSPLGAASAGAHDSSMPIQVACSRPSVRTRGGYEIK